jgi:LuxR family transcriptional regulator, maltose regulon positive regulatory protein
MSMDFPVFRTRLTPPQGKQTVLQRPIINKKLRKISDYPVTVIQSGPGYGKSTTLSSFLKGRDDYCWYSISPQDDGIMIFLHYIIQSVRLLQPSFGENILAMLDRNKSNWITLVCSEFVNECAILSESIIIVLDDIHLIEQSASIRDWMQTFIENIPENIHLVLSGRTELQWPIITKRKAMGDVLIIDEADFLFTYDEIDVLFSDNYQMALEAQQIHDILKITEGWVMAIQLIGQQSREKGTLEKILINKNRSLKDLFQYLTQEVLNKLPEATRDLLKKTCVFEELNPTVISEVLNIHEASRYLRKVANANLFLSALEEGSYRYHALFRDFLIEDLKQNEPALFESLHRQAGSYFENIQNYEQAIYHYEAIPDYKSAASILSFYGSHMIRFGRLESFREKLLEFPADVKDEYPMLWVYEGDIYRYRCQYGQALENYRRAEKQAQIHHRWREESSALEGIAQIFLDTIQPGKAEDYLKRAVEVIPTDEPVNERRNRLTRLMAENLVNLGRAREAEKWLNIKPGQELASINNEKLEPRLLLRMGRLDEATRLLESQKLLEQNETRHLQQSHRETDLLLSLIYSFQGDALKAKALAQEGIIRGVTYKAPFVEACGWIRIGHSVQLTSQYDLNQAATCYKTALRLMDDIQMPRGKAEPLMGLCGVYSQKGEYETAIHYGELALEETDKVNDEWLSALIRICLTKVAVYTRDFERCDELLNQCHQAFDECGDSYGLAVTALWSMILSFEKEDWSAFESHLHQCLEYIEKGNYEFLLNRRTLLGPHDIQKIPQLLLTAKHRGIESPYLQKLMARWKLTDDRDLPGYTLHIQTLGQFRVWLGQQEVGPESWQRSKTKELFQLLLTRRNGWLSREEIMSSLWPDQDAASATSGFKVALNTLYKVLEPERKARGTPYFIERKGPLYRLNLNGMILDVDDFENTLQRALVSQDTKDKIRLLETGIAYYKGDYLPELRFEDWCVEERERIQLLFLRAAEKLAQHFVEQEHHEKAIELCERILQTDKCWEEAYRMIMYCYYRQNNRPQAIKYYKKCTRILEKELGIKPMPATTTIYQKVLEGDYPIHP